LLHLAISATPFELRNEVLVALIAYVNPMIYNTRFSINMKSPTVSFLLFLRVTSSGVSSIQVTEINVSLGTTVTNVSSLDDRYSLSFFDVLLTVHLSIILATDQLNAQILVL